MNKLIVAVLFALPLFAATPSQASSCVDRCRHSILPMDDCLRLCLKHPPADPVPPTPDPGKYCRELHRTDPDAWARQCTAE